MAALHEEVLHRPSEAHQSASSSASATVNSCLDGYIPLYSFSSDKTGAEKAPKLARVDSLPAFPTCVSSPASDGPASCIVPDVEFNDLPIDVVGRVAYADSALASVPPSFNTAMGTNDVTADASYTRLTDGNAKAMAAGSRALPRRNPSDVMLRRPCIAIDDVDGLEVPSRSLLEATLMGQWEDRADRGLFRYDVTQCPSRVLPGRLGFIAQLNEGRATKKRPTELTLDRVLQPFDAAKFNFRKAALSEVLVAFCPLPPSPRRAMGGPARLLPSVAPLVATMAAEATDVQSSSPNLVLINVSPIDYGHVLLVPRVLDNLPQALTVETVLLALRFAQELGSPHFRVGYNSLGAYATINHLHFQSYYQSATMPCEAAATALLPGSLSAPLVRAEGVDGRMLAVHPRKRRFGEDMACSGDGTVRVSRLVGYPVNAFVVGTEVDDGASDGIQAVAAIVGKAAERMQAANQPFNLLISDSGRRVFIFPQCFAERAAMRAIPLELADMGVNPAAFEIAGHLVLKRAQDYTGVTEDLAGRLLAVASLPEERFMALAQMCFGTDDTP